MRVFSTFICSVLVIVPSTVVLVILKPVSHSCAYSIRMTGCSETCLIMCLLDWNDMSGDSETCVSFLCLLDRNDW